MLKRSKIKLVNNRGMTLVEIMVSMAVISLAILGMSRYQIAAIETNRLSRETMQAKILAQDRMEQLKIVNKLELGTWYEDVGRYHVAYTVKEGGELPAGIKLLNIEVTWQHEVRGVTAPTEIMEKKINMQAYRAN